MITIDTAVVYDEECVPNFFSLTLTPLYGDQVVTWEISEFRDDRIALLTWIEWARTNQIIMIGFNNIGYDYPMLHYLIMNPTATNAQLYEKSQQLIYGDRFANTIWPSDRFIPQCDLFKINHFDNKAKTTSLKALQINMRSETVRESALPFDRPWTREEIEQEGVPYNVHDVRETKRFAHICMKAIKFRMGLIEKFGVDALNFNDTKIGTRILEDRLGDEVCYDRSSGRRQPRQTPRNRIPLADVIFPYVRFQNPEFNRVLDYMRGTTLTPDDLEDPDAPIKTKGAFSGLHANVGGLVFHYGTGGVHASVEPQRVISGDGWIIRDIDVVALYPSIAIVNRLAPEHLGDVFVNAYASLPEERAKHAKGTVENASFKLGSNGAYGNSNNQYSWMFDPKYTMATTINGQLMLSMLAEWLLTVPTIQIIQANTDGITYRIREEYLDAAKAIEKQWEAFTCLKLEDATYKRMFIRDVNNYIAEDVKGKLKQKGAYWTPDPFNYEASISEASPPSWHKDLGNIVSIRAAVAAMIHGVDPAHFIMAHSDPFDFMCRVRVTKADQLTLGGAPIQRTTRYYVAHAGAPLVITRPAAGPEGQFKRRNGISDAEYAQIAATLPPGAHDERIHTKNKSRYEPRVTNVEAGWSIAECNHAASFDFRNVNHAFYVAEARKLIIA